MNVYCSEVSERTPLVIQSPAFYRAMLVAPSLGADGFVSSVGDENRTKCSELLQSPPPALGNPGFRRRSLSSTWVAPIGQPLFPHLSEPCDCLRFLRVITHDAMVHLVPPLSKGRSVFVWASTARGRIRDLVWVSPGIQVHHPGAWNGP